MRTVTLCYPIATMPVSVTGGSCGLSCRHCGGVYLKSMKKLPELNKIPEIPIEIKSFLISGGCDKNGAVPLKAHGEAIRALKDAGFRINLHTGLADEDTVRMAAELAGTVSFDFLTDDETISTVYGNGRTGGDYIETLLRLRKSVDVVPHVTIGLLGGKVRGEADAVRALASMEPFRRIVFIVFIPTRGTFYQNALPPDLQEVADIFALARRLMPNTPFSLGCMRPRGQYGEKLQMLAYEYGFDMFVNPSRWFSSFIAGEDVKIVKKEECCALD